MGLGGPAPALCRFPPGRRLPLPPVPGRLGPGPQRRSGKELVLGRNLEHRPVGQHLCQGMGVPDHDEPVPAPQLSRSAAHAPVPVPVLHPAVVIQVQPAGSPARDVPIRRVPVHELAAAVVGLVQVQDHAAHRRGHVPNQPTAGQVPERLAQGRPLPRQLPAPVNRDFVPVDQDKMTALGVQETPGPDRFRVKSSLVLDAKSGHWSTRLRWPLWFAYVMILWHRCLWDTVRCHGGSRCPLGQRPGEVSLPGSVLEGLELPKTAPDLCFICQSLC